MNLQLYLCSLCLTINFADTKPGSLVIVGGGEVPNEVYLTFVELGGGKKARLAVLPQASSRPDRGQASVEVFTKLGVAEAYNVDLNEPKKSRALIRKATAIWFPGGSQAQLYEALNKAGVIDLLQARHRAGIPFAGTSAGAAIMSELMIPNAPKKPGFVTGNTPIAKGLGLAPELIIDQHFVARARMNRLLGAVLDHPDRVGVGIGESTAILVRGAEFTVMGKGSVVVIDARNAMLSRGRTSSLQSGSNIELHVLKSGERFEFK
jgi:cyanophycinase